MDKKALTLMEIVVSLVILSLTMYGMLNVFIAAKSHSLRSRTLISASELGKYFLDQLQLQVRQDTWGNTNNCIGPNATSGCPGAQTITNYGSTLTYTPTYTVTNVVGTGYVGDCTASDCLRRVQVSISWPTR